MKYLDPSDQTLNTLDIRSQLGACAHLTQEEIARSIAKHNERVAYWAEIYTDLASLEEDTAHVVNAAQKLDYHLRMTRALKNELM